MMEGEAPPFWWRERSWQSLLLAPAARIYSALARRNLRRGRRADAGLPVLCVGNFIVGGGGKTPTAMALGKAAKAMGLRPGFVSRGHGRVARMPLLVDPDHHGLADVGDEALLLARVAPTAVAVDRSAAVTLLRHGAGADFIIMDDGFQSARLAVDYALVVLDARRGVGNGRVIPAGPLRAPLIEQIQYADALLVVGRGEAGDEAIRRTARGNKPVFEARLAPLGPEPLAGRRVLAFAGIADPEKFYATLRSLGADLAQTRDFPDHHPFRREEMDELSASAWRDGLQLVTTRKDAVRLEKGGEVARLFLREVDILDVDLVFEPETLGTRIIRDTLAAHRKRRFG